MIFKTNKINFLLIVLIILNCICASFYSFKLKKKYSTKKFNLISKISLSKSTGTSSNNYHNDKINASLNNKRYPKAANEHIFGLSKQNNVSNIIVFNTTNSIIVKNNIDISLLEKKLGAQSSNMIIENSRTGRGLIIKIKKNLPRNLDEKENDSLNENKTVNYLSSPNQITTNKIDITRHHKTATNSNVNNNTGFELTTTYSFNSAPESSSVTLYNVKLSQFLKSTAKPKIQKETSIIDTDEEETYYESFENASDLDETKKELWMEDYERMEDNNPGIEDLNEHVLESYDVQLPEDEDLNYHELIFPVDSQISQTILSEQKSVLIQEQRQKPPIYLFSSAHENRPFSTSNHNHLRRLPIDAQHDDYKCPPPPSIIPLNNCNVTDCESDKDCVTENLKCCFDGCKYTCMIPIQPSSFIDWVIEPKKIGKSEFGRLRKLKSHAYENLQGDIEESNWCSTTELFYPDEEPLLCAHGFYCEIFNIGNLEEGISNIGRCVPKLSEAFDSNYEDSQEANLEIKEIDNKTLQIINSTITKSGNILYSKRLIKNLKDKKMDNKKKSTHNNLKYKLEEETYSEKEDGINDVYKVNIELIEDNNNSTIESITSNFNLKILNNTKIKKAPRLRYFDYEKLKSKKKKFVNNETSSIENYSIKYIDSYQNKANKSNIPDKYNKRNFPLYESFNSSQKLLNEKNNQTNPPFYIHVLGKHNMIINRDETNHLYSDKNPYLEEDEHIAILYNDMGNKSLYFNKIFKNMYNDQNMYDYKEYNQYNGDRLNTKEFPKYED